MFETEWSENDSDGEKLAKHILGMAAFVRWVNSFPQHNIKTAGESDKILSDYLSGFFALSKDDEEGVLYLGVQKEEAKWLSLLPFHTASLDIERGQLGLLCDGAELAYKKLQPLNIIIPISDLWKMEQLVNLRKLVMVGISTDGGIVGNLHDVSGRHIPLLHQSIASASRLYAIEQRRRGNPLSSLF